MGFSTRIKIGVARMTEDSAGNKKEYTDHSRFKVITGKI